MTPSPRLLRLLARMGVRAEDSFLRGSTAGSFRQEIDPRSFAGLGRRMTPIEPLQGQPRRVGGDMLFGGAPLGVRQMRRLAGLEHQADKPVPELNEDLERTNADFFARLPDHPDRWQEAMGLHPWISTPARAEAVIMANARLPNGAFKYSNDDIIARTRLRNENSLKATLSQARGANVPLRLRRHGSSSPGPKTLPGGVKLRRMAHVLLNAARQGVRMTNAEVAEAIGSTPGAVNNKLWQIRHGRGNHRGIPQAIRDQIAEFDALVTRASPKAKKLIGAILPYLAGAGAGTAIANVASREGQRRAILDQMNRS